MSDECGETVLSSGTTAIVCGGRDYRNGGRVFQILDAAVDRLGVVFILQGVAEGADYLAWQWAQGRGVRCGSYPAHWKEDRKNAGPIRNGRMLSEGKPDMVIAFPGGKGTADMVRQAEVAGVRIIKVDW